METLPVDVTAIVGIIFGTSIFIIPILGFTVRYALKPFVEALAAARGNKAELSLLEQRVALLERQLDARPLERLPAVSPIAASNEGVPLRNDVVRVTPER